MWIRTLTDCLLVLFVCLFVCLSVLFVPGWHTGFVEDDSHVEIRNPFCTVHAARTRTISPTCVPIALLHVKQFRSLQSTSMHHAPPAPGCSR